MKSVEVTRVIPSRWAASVATVDLPVPVAPPTSSRIGRSSAAQRREPAHPEDDPSALVLAEQLGGDLLEPLELDRRAAAVSIRSSSRRVASS